MSLLRWVWAWAAGSGPGTPTTPYSGIIVMSSATWTYPRAGTESWNAPVTLVTGWTVPEAAAETWD